MKQEGAVCWLHLSLSDKDGVKARAMAGAAEPCETPTVHCQDQSGPRLSGSWSHGSGGRRTNLTNTSQSQDTIGTGTGNHEASLQQPAASNNAPG